MLKVATATAASQPGPLLRRIFDIWDILQSRYTAYTITGHTVFDQPPHVHWAPVQYFRWPSEQRHLVPPLTQDQALAGRPPPWQLRSRTR